MKKIMENLYIFSKLSISLFLFLSLLGALYLLYSNYNEEKYAANKRNNISSELQTNINNNLDLIEKISKEIKSYEISLNDIKKSIEILSNKSQESYIEQTVVDLKKTINYLSEEIKNLQIEYENKPVANSKKNSDVIHNNLNDIIELILIKFENNISYNKELDFLIKKTNKNKTADFEKILLLSSEPYKGHQYLKDKFNEEVNFHLKRVINVNPDSLLSKIIFPYLEVSPTTENIPTNDLIIKIKKVQLNIENSNISEALNILKNIEDYQNIFKLSSLEMKKFVNFKNEILKLK